MAKALVIVESPAKARTIAKYLGDEFVVESSIGHIRDLPATASEIPAKFKDEPWARLGVNVDDAFEPLYIIPKDKKSHVTKLRQMLKEVDELYLATDEDREGEAIAWHLQQVLKPKVPVKRMVFSEITKAAIGQALSKTRTIDNHLVQAQEARRVLDRLYGYEVSPVLWRKIRPKLSAGRVQSVATRLVVDRERARMRFVSAEYWDLAARLRVPDEGSRTSFGTRLVEVGGRRVAIGKDFEETTGQLAQPDAVRLLDEAAARALAEQLESSPFRVHEVREKPFSSRPYPPFITSTLQQEAGRKLRFSAQRTMSIAQGLYENGYITYMRTDSTNLSSQAIDAAREQIAQLYGPEYLPESPRAYKSKSKNAQEAHEAIRPAGETFRTPKSLAGELDPSALKLYELIWKRTVACQMKDARGVRTNVRIHADVTDEGKVGAAVFTASGKVIQFAGFLRAYVEGSDDPEAELEDQEKILPALTQGQTLGAESIEANGHSTQPPARFTEASLVKELEERGIGRPSTYASILQTIQDRGYVQKRGTALVPTFTAFAVTKLLEGHLAELVDLDFTARMENGLDSIASGRREASPWLHDFYFGRSHGEGTNRDTAAAATTVEHGATVREAGLKGMVGSGWDAIDPRVICSIPLGETPDGEAINVRVGRFGPYVQIPGHEERATVPDDIAPDELTIAMALEMLEKAAQGDQVLGTDPATDKPVYVKTGRFGDYVQLGDPETTAKGNRKKGSKPKMASLWPSMDRVTITLEEALMLLSFPREVGAHPETGAAITAQDGRFGPYLKMGTESRSLPGHEKLATVTLEEAVELFKQAKGRQRSSALLGELGAHPETELPLQVKNGRFGPYVTDGVVNATVPKGKDPAALTLEEAVELIAAREQKLRDQGKDPRAVKKKAPRRKPAAKRK